MTPRELKTLRRIPKKYREHIVDIGISLTDNYNERGQRLFEYKVTWDNGDIHYFENQDFMIWKIKEYSVDGYICD